jgi:PAS domain S-box-containing protein
LDTVKSSAGKNVEELDLEKVVNILLIEDSEDDAIIIEKAIIKGGLKPEIFRVENKRELLETINYREWDIAVTDNELPSFNAESAIKIIKEKLPDLPIIIVSGSISEEQIVKFMKAGAQDYIAKSNFTRLVPGIEREIRESQILKERNQAKKELKKAKKASEALINATIDAACLLDAEGIILTANKTFAARFDSSIDYIIGKNVKDVISEPDVFDYRQMKIKDSVYSKKALTFIDFRDGRWYENSLFPIFEDDGAFSQIAIYSKDITENKIAQDSLAVQKAFLQQLFDDAPVAIAIVDNDWSVVRINKQFEKIYEYSSSDLVGRYIGGFITPPSRLEEIEKIKYAVNSGNLISFETQRTTKSGILKDVVFVGKPIFLENNKIGLLAMYVDISSLKKAEHESAENREKFKAITENTPNVAIHSFNEDGKIYFWNKASENIFGYSASEAQGKSILELSDYGADSPNIDITELINQFNKKNNSIGPFLWRIKNKSGKRLILSVTIFKIQSKENDKYIAMCVDISERIEAENKNKALHEALERKVQERTQELNSALSDLTETNTELSILNEAFVTESRRLLMLNDKLAVSEYQLKQMVAAKDKIISIIAHDLKNPLHSLLLSSDILVNYGERLDLKAIAHEHSKIYNSAKIISDLLNDLLQWALAQSDGVQFSPEVHESHEIIEDVLSLLRSSAEKKNIILESYVEMGVSLFCDKQMISSVFRNLISNAIKFSNSGSKVWIECQEIKGYIRFIINDQGVGISEENIDKLFRVDYSVSSLGTAQEKGTGLGLVICKEFVEKHKGNIYTESSIGRGSRFIFELPTYQ